MKSVSAIVVNWNDRKATAECVRSLQSQDHERVEIIICDNGSYDGSASLLKQEFPDVRVIELEENLGFGPAVNRGLTVATGEYLIFLNNDLVLAPDCLRQMSKALEADRSLGGVVPKILYSDPPDSLNSFGVDIHYTGMACPHLIGVADSPHLTAYETACGGIFMVPRAVYQATGGFDPDLFLYHEDHDWSWRIRLLGWRLETCPQAVMSHDYKFNKGVFKYYSSEKNRLILLLKNYRWKTLFFLIPALLAVELAQFGHALTHGWFKLKLKSYVEIAKAFPELLEKRKQVQATRTAEDREIMGLHENHLRVSGFRHPLLENWLSPFLEWYGERVRRRI